jgi:outer membrane protein assembly factor BamA
LYGTGVDLEYHQPLYRYITAVARLQAGYSGGSSRVLYNLGGVDNNLTIRTDSNVHFQQEAPYAFQTLITPLRGYLQNSIYGNEYALTNLDVYFPLFESLIPVETPLSFVNNLQPGLFMDYAYAKETWRADTNGVTKWSYGISARSTLAGYPVRVDVAWPGSFDKKPVWYLSLSLR